MDLPLNCFDPDGSLWLLNKPLTWTSFDVVNKVRNILRQKVGHAGTLDPLASGLLILGSGRGTKTMESLMGQEKEYTGTLTLGQTTPSADRETAVNQERPWQHLTEADIRAAVVTFTGLIQQRPPLFSAIKINGKKAYELARKGRDVVRRRNAPIHAATRPRPAQRAAGGVGGAAETDAITYALSISASSSALIGSTLLG